MSTESAFHLSTPATMPPSAGCSQLATVSSGRLIFIAGQVALDTHGNVVGPGDVRAQARRVFENLRAAVESVGGSFRDVVKLNTYFLDAAALPDFRAVRDEYVDTANPPASTAAQVARLFRPEFLLEVEAIAVVK